MENSNDGDVAAGLRRSLKEQIYILASTDGDSGLYIKGVYATREAAERAKTKRDDAYDVIREYEVQR
jgi:hypothetical protein